MPAERIDWTALCNHPGVIFTQRMALLMFVPAMVWVGSSFIDMRDAMRDTKLLLQQVDVRLTEHAVLQRDHEMRLRDLERFVPPAGR